MEGTVHEFAGERVAATWQLPVRVRTAIAPHHNLAQLSSDPLLAVLLVAEHAANEQGFAVDVAGAGDARSHHHAVASYDVQLVHGPEAGLGARALHRAHRQLGRDIDAALRAVRSSQ